MTLPHAQPIGYSAEGRPLRMYLRGECGTPLRVLVVAGQHGDELLAQEAAQRFAETFDVARFPNVRLAVLASANPDGAAMGTRTNAHGRDLNRDHLLLRSPETQALHRFVRTWQPHLIIDVHTYPPRRKALLRHGLIHGCDVLLDLPTHPNAYATGGALLREGLLALLTKTLSEHGLHGGRYFLLTRSGRVRHSTPDIVDARNGLALRYSIPVILLEGRAPSRRVVGATRRRTRQALQLALEVILDWSAAPFTSLHHPAAPPTPGTSIVLRAAYQRTECALTIPMLTTQGEAAHPTEIPGRYTPTLRVKEAVPLPSAYAVPLAARAVRHVLHRHGYEARPAEGRVPAEQLVPEAVVPSSRARRAPRRLRLCAEATRIDLSRYALFPTEQLGGCALAVLLEPASKYGLARMVPSALPLRAGEAYPVLRIP